MTSINFSLTVSTQRVADIANDAVREHSPWVISMHIGDDLRGSVTYMDESDSTVTRALDPEDFRAGLVAMGSACPSRLAEILDADGMHNDAITADCLLQCVVFGQLVYG